jgi:NTP pyrophosphatase (non-canonical NTP hydrolase)
MPIAHWRQLHSPPRHDAWLHTNRSKKMSSYRTIEMNVIQWAEARKIIPNSTPQAQFLKAVSEMGELADAINKRDMDATKDAVGDTLVCLINMCALLDIDMVECLERAWHEIKDRKGTLLPSGVFVKE